MKKIKEYVKELVVLILQLLMFYAFPLLAGPTDAMGMVVIIILGTLLFSLFMGVLSDKKIKYLYPIVVALLFIPSVFIYYNDSAFIHSVWYLIISVIGVLIGSRIKSLFNKKG